jgi:hypothetical protein
VSGLRFHGATIVPIDSVFPIRTPICYSRGEDSEASNLGPASGSRFCTHFRCRHHRRRDESHVGTVSPYVVDLHPSPGGLLPGRPRSKLNREGGREPRHSRGSGLHQWCSLAMFSVSQHHSLLSMFPVSEEVTGLDISVELTFGRRTTSEVQS